MEVVGGVASVLNLVQAAGLLTKVAWNTCQRLHDAPKELRELTHQLAICHDELQRVHLARNDGHALLLAADIRKQFEAALAEAREALDELDGISTCIKDPAKIASRVRWVVKDRKLATKVLDRLESAKERLGFMINILNLYVVDALVVWGTDYVHSGQPWYFASVIGHGGADHEGLGNYWWQHDRRTAHIKRITHLDNDDKQAES